MTTNKNIIVIGFMGAGKSLISKNLSARLHREVVETDQLIIDQEKRPISEIFADKGEAYFRRIEKEVVARVSKRNNIIIDCGGGVVIDEENVKNLKENGIVFYLSASVDELYERTKDEDSRPLLNVEDPKAKIEEMLKVRQPFYMKADVVIDTNKKSVDEVCSEILDKVGL